MITYLVIIVKQISVVIICFSAVLYGLIARLTDVIMY